MAKKKEQEVVIPMEHKSPSKQWSSFDQFWLSVSSAKKLDGRIKEAVKKHFNAKGFDKPEKFEDGLRSFGIK